MPLPSVCRRFRFSLRTLFVVVTVICVWLGWQVHIVQHRMAMLKQLKETNVVSVPEWRNGMWVTDPLDWMHHSQVTVLRVSHKSKWPSWLRRLLGDCIVTHLGFDRELTDADRRAISAFPEAMIEAWP